MEAKTERYTGKDLDAVDLQEKQNEIKVSQVFFLVRRTSAPKSQWGLGS